MNVVGMHLSDTASIDYGVMLAPSFSDTTVVGASGRHTQRHFTPEAGAFFNYAVLHGLAWRSSLMYGGSSVSSVQLRTGWAAS